MFENQRKKLHRRLKHNDTYMAIRHAVLGAQTIVSEEKRKIIETEKEIIRQQKIDKVFCEWYVNGEINDKMVVYESFHGSSISCNPLAMLRRMLFDPRCVGFHHVVVLDPPAELPNEFLYNDQISVISREDEKYGIYLATAKYLINNSTFPSWYLRREGQVYLNTWHGIPLKTMFKHDKGSVAGHGNSQRNFLQASHLTLATDYAVEKILGAADVLPLVCEKTYVCPTPRLEATFKTQQTRNTKTDGSQILFAPTWKGKLGFVADGLEEFRVVVSSLISQIGPKDRLLIKPHNFVATDAAKITNEVEKEYVNRIKILDGTEDINDVLGHTDVLITDYSSIMMDAFAANIPTVLFVPEREKYEEERGLYLALEELPAAICETPWDLAKCVKARKMPSKFGAEDYTRVKQMLFANEGEGGSAQLVNLIFGGEHSLKPFAKNSKKNIIIMGGGWLRNGITTSATNLLSNLDYRKYNVVVTTDGRGLRPIAWEQLEKIPDEVMLLHRVGSEGFTADEIPVKKEFYRSNNLSTPAQDKLFERTMQREWRRIVGDTKFDVSMDFSGYRRLWSLIFGFSTARKKVIFQHNDLFSEMTKKYPELKGVFWSYRAFDFVASVSDETRELNYSNLKTYCHNAKSITIRNMIDLESLVGRSSFSNPKMNFRGQTYRCFSVGNRTAEGTLSLNIIEVPNSRRKTFVTIGRFSEEKNHAMLLKAFCHVVEQRQDVHLYIVGEGPLLEDTRKLRDKLGLNGYVSIPGYTSEALALLNSCDCFVLPSLYEGQPMVILEALTLGKPVIVTDIAGSRSALKGGYGHIAKGVDELEFSKAMLDFCTGNLKFKEFDGKRYNREALQDIQKVLS